jgi:DNA polymerase-3 subunit epsilon
MREIVLDTETTGLSPNKGDRVVEIGCVELINHVPTENTFQVYLNPERDMDEGAQRVHGLTNEFLLDKPKFSEIAEEFISYIGESKIIAHNARNSLDALCKRFLVDNSNRKLHGALLDSELLAEVYLELIGGKEPDLALAVEKKAINQSNEEVNGFIAKRDKALKPRLTEEEQIKHKNFIETLKVKPLWYG